MRFLGLVFSILMGGLPVFAAQLKGVTFDDKIKVSGQSLVLNGLGVRKATIFKVSVYVAGLYVYDKSNDPNALLASNYPKTLILKFVRDVDADDLREAWTDGVNDESNCKDYCLKIKKPLEKLNSFMTKVKTSETLKLSFSMDGIEVLRPDGKTLSIKDKNFANVLLRIWLGDNPPNSDLKTGLLGIPN